MLKICWLIPNFEKTCFDTILSVKIQSGYFSGFNLYYSFHLIIYLFIHSFIHHDFGIEYKAPFDHEKYPKLHLLNTIQKFTKKYS